MTEEATPVRKSKAQKRLEARERYAALFASPEVTQLAAEAELLEQAISNAGSTFEKFMMYRAVLALENIAASLGDMVEPEPTVPLHWVVRSPFAQDS